MHGRRSPGPDWLLAHPEADATRLSFDGVPEGDHWLSLWDEAAPDGSRPAQLAAPPKEIRVDGRSIQEFTLRVPTRGPVELTAFDGDTREPLSGVELVQGHQHIALTGPDGVARFDYFRGRHDGLRIRTMPSNDYEDGAVALDVEGPHRTTRLGIALYPRP